MNALIPILQNGTKLAVSARELYHFLELDPSQFARWSKHNTAENPAASSGDDWIAIRHDGETPTGGRIEREDFALSINFAKELAMMARPTRGKQAREYFLECEHRALATASAIALPPTYAEALRALADTVEEKERLALANVQMAPKAEFFDAITGSKDAIKMAAVAKVLDFPNLGRTKLFRLLRDCKILRHDNTPYQEFVDRKYFRLIEQKWTKPDGTTHVGFKTLVYQRGLDFIRQVLRGQLREVERASSRLAKTEK